MYSYVHLLLCHFFGGVYLKSLVHLKNLILCHNYFLIFQQLMTGALKLSLCQVFHVLVFVYLFIFVKRQDFFRLQIQ